MKPLPCIVVDDDTRVEHFQDRRTGRQVARWSIPSRREWGRNRFGERVSILWVVVLFTRRHFSDRIVWRRPRS
jgi:hypothetical protein